MPLHVARRVHKLPFHHVQNGLMPPAKHHMPSNKAHITEFGLRIMERDPNTKAAKNFTLKKSANAPRRIQLWAGKGHFEPITTRSILILNIAQSGLHISYYRTIKRTRFSLTSNRSRKRYLITSTLVIRSPLYATIKSALDSESSVHSFEADWALVEGFGLEVQVLRDFCGGIATVPANTATVESDFSILGWEKDEYRKCLSDLALEGIMHSKQFELLGNLAWRWFSGQML